MRSGFDSSDMYLEDFKKSFGQAESRNAASRANKKMSMQIKVGGRDDDNDDFENSDMRESFGKRGGGKGGLAELKSKLSLKEELGALRSELGKPEAPSQI